LRDTVDGGGEIGANSPSEQFRDAGRIPIKHLHARLAEILLAPIRPVKLIAAVHAGRLIPAPNVINPARNFLTSHAVVDCGLPRLPATPSYPVHIADEQIPPPQRERAVRYAVKIRVFVQPTTGEAGNRICLAAKIYLGAARNRLDPYREAVRLARVDGELISIPPPIRAPA